MTGLIPVFLAAWLLMAPVTAAPLPDAAVQVTGASHAVDTRGGQGDTMLHWMAFTGNTTRVSRLIAAGADINVRLNNGSTPLHLAAYNGHTGVASLLLARGAAVNAHTDTGVSPLDWAQHNDHRAMERLLLANGALASDTESSNLHGQTHPGNPVPRIRPGQLLASYRQATGPVIASPAVHSSSTLADRPGRTAQEQASRIQLAALSNRQRIDKAWAQYRRRHPDILEGVELFIEPVLANGKEIYRVQTGPLIPARAESMCDHLRERNQPCIVIHHAFRQ
jgi:cell division septation protein DedD